MKKSTLSFALVSILCSFQVALAQSPKTAAPTPTYTVEANFVRSLYNSTATYEDAGWFVPAWGQEASLDYAEAGDDGECMVFRNLGWLPIQINKPFNLRDDVKYVHFDFYANEATDIRFGFQTWVDGEVYFPTLKYTTPGEWQSIDFPIELLINAGLGQPKEAIVLRIGGDNDGCTYAGEIFVDNIFAYDGEPKNLYQAPSGPPTTAAPIPTYSVEENFVRSLYNSSGTYEDAEWFIPAWGQEASLDYAEAGPEGECMVIRDLGWLPMQISKPFNLRDDVKYVHFDFYANEETDIRFGFQTWADGEVYFPAIKYTTPGQWQSIDFPIELLINAGLGQPKEAIVLRIGGDNDGYTYASEIYIDNIFAFDGEPENLYTSNEMVADIEPVDVNIFPTLVSDDFTCTVGSGESIRAIQVYGLSGQRVKSIQNDNTVNISSASPGMYLVVVQLSNGSIVTKKIIKQ
ncbi:T9SS type A sorting domain-containing protein [Parabacteroides sp. OttesenSCG-928-N08]|nr:T9SS type A sorting domain-containing protein [Parabacteroides sp. OttesenSCG-928-N08]